MYDLDTVKKVYSYWGKKRTLYNISSKISFFGYENFLRNRVIGLMNLKEGSRVLDVACGTGLNFKFIENKIGPSGKIIAIDYVKEMLEAAEKEMKSRQYKNIRLILGDAASMSFPNNYFDGIVSTLGLTAIPNHFEALKRCKKMLKPNGKIAILDGKYSDMKYAKFIINSLLKVIRLEGTWDSKKDVIKDLGKLFSITKSEKYFFDTIFILVGEKCRTHD